MGNPRVMKRRKRSCKSKSSFFFFPNLRYGRFNFFFDSAGFAGAFVDRIVETKGVSQVFFSLSLSLDNWPCYARTPPSNVQRWTSLIKRRRRELRMMIMLPISLLGIIKLVDPCWGGEQLTSRNVNCWCKSLKSLTIINPWYLLELKESTLRRWWRSMKDNDNDLINPAEIGAVHVSYNTTIQ